MADCINYNCTALGTHDLVTCDEFAPGGVKDIILIECGITVTDPSDGTEINNLLTAGDAKLVENVKWDKPLSAPIQVDSPVACRTPQLVNYDHTANLTDGNVTENNVDFYNEVNSGRSFGGLIVHECGLDRVTYYDEEIQATGGRVIPAEDNEFQVNQSVFTWRSKTEGSIHATPTGVFS
jgi:hypothetical protein